MKSNFKEHDLVKLQHKIIEEGLHEGEIGTVVNIYQLYEVEFPNSAVSKVITLPASAIKLVGLRDHETSP